MDQQIINLNRPNFVPCKILCHVTFVDSTSETEIVTIRNWFTDKCIPESQHKEAKFVSRENPDNYRYPETLTSKQ